MNPLLPLRAEEMSSGLQAQLEVLRAAYAARLDEKIAAICAGWTHILDLESEPGLNRTSELDDLHRATHTLAGSGATFGFPEVSRAARRAEMLLKDLAQGRSALDDDFKMQMQNALTELQASSQPGEARPAFEGPVEFANSDSESETRSVYLFCDGDAATGEPTWASSIDAFGYAIEIFHELDAFESALEKQPPAAIIVDCHSEPMSCEQGGRLLSSVLAEVERRNDAASPVVWVCAQSDMRARLQAVRLGGAAFFARPVDIDSLLVKLDDLTAHNAPEPLRVLIVDDEASLGRLFSVILRQAGMETHVVSDPMQVTAPLTDFHPDLILMDVYMPSCSGLELASVIRQQEAYIGIPIVFLSVETDVSKQLQAMQQGGDDFLIKPVQPRHLISAVTTRATRARALRNLMMRDSLTGLLNHTKTKEQLDIEMSRAARIGNSLALAMLDIDQFKVVNDTYGHATGDRVLRSLSRLLGQKLRQTDVIGRYGGEEFAAVLTGSNAEDARDKLETIRVAFANLEHYADGHEFRVTFSAGIAASPPITDVVALSIAADRALYKAKRAGRNRVVIAE